LHKSLQRLQTDYLDLYQLLARARRCEWMFWVRDYSHTDNTNGKIILMWGNRSTWNFRKKKENILG
jgi:diketogulonate reductase-like aldo/keto reductase